MRYLVTASLALSPFHPYIRSYKQPLISYTDVVWAVWDVPSNDPFIKVLRLPDLDEVATIKLQGHTLPRSVLLTTFHEQCYLLAGLGDGHLVSYILQSKTDDALDEDQQGAATTELELGSCKKVALGSHPVALSTFQHAQSSMKGDVVFCTGDRPTVMYAAADGKVLFANVNLKEVSFMCPFNASMFPGCLALASEHELTVGTVDSIQKLHIRTVRGGMRRL